MIIKETRILECWCPVCGEGQMEKILRESFELKKPLPTYIGETILCKCGAENKVDDFVSIVPGCFYVHSTANGHMGKVNEEVLHFLNSDE